MPYSVTWLIDDIFSMLWSVTSGLSPWFSPSFHVAKPLRKFRYHYTRSLYNLNQCTWNKALLIGPFILPAGYLLPGYLSLDGPHTSFNSYPSPGSLSPVSQLLTLVSSLISLPFIFISNMSPSPGRSSWAVFFISFFFPCPSAQLGTYPQFLDSTADF